MISDNIRTELSVSINSVASKSAQSSWRITINKQFAWLQIWAKRIFLFHLIKYPQMSIIPMHHENFLNIHFLFGIIMGI